MSYSLNDPCWNCSKKDKCTDTKDIQNGINAIHQKKYEEGHQGSGCIILQCVKQNRD